MARTIFPCTGTNRFVSDGLFTPKCWLVEIFLEEEHRRIAEGALVQPDVVSTSANALGSL